MINLSSCIFASMKHLTLIVFFALTSCLSFSQGFTFANADHGVSTLNTGAISHGAGVTFFDFNKDGLDDVTFCTASDSLIFFQSTGDSLIRIEIIPNTLDMRMASWVDFDNDGDYDLLVTKARNIGNNSKLYRNDGWPVFTDITNQLNLPNFGGVRSYGHSWADYDKDGLIDVYVCNYNISGGITNWLFHNNGDGTFSEVSAAAGVGNGSRLSFQSAWCDFNNDGWLDLYVVNDLNQPSAMFYNNGDGTFTDVSVATGTNIQIEAMCISIVDHQDDGDWDIYVSNIATGNYFLINENGNFTNQAAAANLTVNRMTWGSTWVDFDNDGDQDIHMVTTQGGNNQNPFFVNNGDNTFTENNSIGFEGDITNAYSNAKGDFNNDGFYELIHSTVGSQNSYRFWENIGVGGNWVKIDLTGTVSNRDAIGSTVEYWINGVPKRYMTFAGEGFLSQNAHTKIIGIAEASAIDSIQITWPNGLIESHYELMAGNRYDFIEGQTLSNSISIVEETNILCESLTLFAGDFQSVLWEDGSTESLRTITSAGVYTANVTHPSGVIISSSIEIVQGIVPAIEITSTNVTCFGLNNASISVLEINGAEVSLTWNTDTGLLPDAIGPGIYEVVAESIDGCINSASVEITEPLVLETNLTTTDVLCFGEASGTAAIEVFGGTPEYIIDWSMTDPNAITAGVYAVEVEDANGCISTLNFEIFEPTPLALADAIVTNAENGSNGAIIITIEGGVEPYSYLWNNGDQDNLNDFIGQGIHTCVVTDANGCTFTYEGNIIDVNIEENIDQNISVFPVPASEVLFIQNMKSGTQVKIIDINGKMLLHQNSNTDNIQVDITEWPAGVYFIQFNSTESHYTRKIIIE